MPESNKHVPEACESNCKAHEGWVHPKDIEDLRAGIKQHGEVWDNDKDRIIGVRKISGGEGVTLTYCSDGNRQSGQGSYNYSLFGNPEDWDRILMKPVLKPVTDKEMAAVLKSLGVKK